VSTATSLWDLVVDNHTTGGRLATSLVVVLSGVVLAMVVSRLLMRRADDALSRYYGRKVVRYVVAIVVLFVLAAVWRAFAGRVGVVLGFATAGVAFAMQEAIGALAGWFNIVSGRIFRVGDRIQMGGVRGDVIDITPLRTKVMEIGSASAGDSWVRGRQYTGRIVAISNKATFTEPVFNYSAAFEFIWEELSLPLAYGDDWDAAEAILQEEVRRASASAGAQRAIDEMTRRYPVPRAEIEPSVYVQASDDYVTLSARFVVPVRTARTVKDEVTRRVLDRLEEAGISVASSTLDVNVRQEPPPSLGGDGDH
jgi:small-conductance mechanosensitive channel